jgi:hypothetical protein
VIFEKKSLAEADLDEAFDTAYEPGREGKQTPENVTNS